VKVLVTGDRGYLGAVMVPHLLEAGHDVVGLDAGWYDGCDFGTPFTDYEQRTGDVRDTTPVDFRGVDAVVHLAGESIAGRWSSAKKQRIRASRVGVGHDDV
jgi:nucleoside-diphosphate-sugar epimerase